MKWYSYVICCVLIIVGAICTVNLVNIWDNKSSIVGEIGSIETVNDYSQICRLDYSTVTLETEDNINYSSSQAFGAVDFDGAKKDYVLFFNDTLVKDTTIKSGEISANVILNFYSTDGQLASVCDLSVEIKFYDDKTVVDVSTVNENNSIAYYTRYATVNGAIFKVVERSAYEN